ncbi:hypothetical protein D5S17_00960 [Pseudonocardiaceae bacterium YIM PH 21723]|nr:hypothetical protein D5S17_00960 [Pseudonocardiaceae bacterium YIM PH 21723]
MSAPTASASLRLMLSDLESTPVIKQLRAGFRIALWHQPNRPTPADQRKLYAFLATAAREVFAGADHSGYWEQRRQAGFFDAIGTFALIVTPEGKAIGWGGYTMLDSAGKRTLYADYTGVLPEYRRYQLGTWLAARFMKDELRLSRSLYLTLRTQNPCIYRGLLRNLGPDRVWPPLHGDTPPRVFAIAEATAAQLGQTDPLDPKSLVITGVLAKLETTLYGSRPVSEQDDVDRLFGRLTQDDAIMVIARLDVFTLLYAAKLRVLDALRPSRKAAAKRASAT